MADALFVVLRWPYACPKPIILNGRVFGDRAEAERVLQRAEGAEARSSLKPSRYTVHQLGPTDGTLCQSCTGWADWATPRRARTGEVARG